MEKRRVRVSSLPPAKQGMQVRKEQTYLGGLPTNADQYAKPYLSVASFVSPVPRDEANIEAEKGETMITPMGDDAKTRTIPKTFTIGGKKHYNGGTPLNVPEGTFIYSDHLKETNMDIHSVFGKKEKKSGYTYAELSKPFMLNEDIKRLVDPNSDKISLETAKMNIKNKIQKLSLLSILQESKKGFGEDGNFEVPDIAMPYLEKSGLNIADAINPYLEAIKEKSPQMQQQAMMNQTPPPQGPQSPMPMRGGIAKKGGLVRMKNGGAVPSYQNAGEVVGLKPGHRVDKETGQIIDETGNVVGQFKYGNGGTTDINKSSIPSDAVIIKRNDYATEAEYIAARDAAFKEQGTKKAIYVQTADGSYKKVVSKPQEFDPYTGELLETVFNKKQAVADQYYYIEKHFNTPEMKAALAEKAIEALKDKANRRGVTDATAKKMIQKLEDDPELAYNQFMEMQKRNLGLIAHDYEPSKFNNSPAKGKVTNKEFEEAFTKVGINTPKWEDAALQQASYIGYQRLLDDRDAGKIEDKKLLNDLSRFTVTQVGKNDDIISGKAGKGMISAVDGIYTNTTAGQIAGIKQDPMIAEEDPNLVDVATTESKKKVEIQNIPDNNPYGWRAPDIQRLASAMKWKTSDVREMPWARTPDYYIPNVYLDSPDERAFNERGRIAALEQTLGAYATPGALAATSSAMSGAGNIGAYISQVGKENKETVNKHMYAVSDTLNKVAGERASIATKTNENRQMVNEKHREFKRNAEKLFDDSFDWGWNQASRLATLNQRYRNFKIDPLTGKPYKTGMANIAPSTGQEAVLMTKLGEYIDKYPGVDQKVLLEAAKSDLGMDTKYEQVPQYMNYGQAALPPDYSEYYGNQGEGQ